jgi:hypothetical protein
VARTRNLLPLLLVMAARSRPRCWRNPQTRGSPVGSGELPGHRTHDRNGGAFGPSGWGHSARGAWTATTAPAARRASSHSRSASTSRTNGIARTLGGGRVLRIRFHLLTCRRVRTGGDEAASSPPRSPARRTGHLRLSTNPEVLRAYPGRARGVSRRHRVALAHRADASIFTNMNAPSRHSIARAATREPSTRPTGIGS